MTDDPHADTRLRPLDPSPPARRDPVVDTDWGRALHAAITSGATGRARRRARRAAGVAATAATVVAIAGLVAVLFVSTGHDGPPASDGPTVLVATPAPGGPPATPESLGAAAAILVERAGLLGVTGVSATPRGADALEVIVPEDAPDGLQSQITAPGRLLMLPDLPVTGRSVLGLDAAVRTAQEAAGVPVTGGGDEALPDGYAVVREGPAGGDPVTADHLVYRTTLAVTEADVAAAQATPDSPEPAVTLQFTPTGARAFTALTRRVAREGRTRGRPESIAIAMDGRLLTRVDVDYDAYPDGLDGSSGAQLLIPGDLSAGAVAAGLASGPLPLDLSEASRAEPAPGDPVVRAYLGVSCPRANDPTCDRVGLSVTLREAARSVEAVIDGRRLRLDDPDWSGPAEGGLRTLFAGFLSPAGLEDGALRIPEAGTSGGRWIGEPPVSAPVDLFITAADGTTTTVTLEVQLWPGWG